MKNEIEHAVSTGVELLLPRGSCSPGRWLTFEFEGTNAVDTFEWKAQYSAVTNYVSHRVLWGNVPHVKISRYRGKKCPYTPWIPLADLEEGQYVEREHGESLVAPGFVISSGHHDSCWRDHASDLSGYPFVPRNTYEDRDGKQSIYWQPTRWFRILHDTVIKVTRISVEGPVNQTSWVGKEIQEKFSTFTDGSWENDTELIGPWAIYHGLSNLAPTIGKESLEFRLRGIFQRGKYGTRSHREESATVHYRIKDGLVTFRGTSDENGWYPTSWVEVEKPYLLDEVAFFNDCKVKREGRGAFELTHLFPYLQGG